MSSSNNSSGSALSFLSFVDGLWDLAKVAKVIYFTICFDVLFYYLKGNGLFGIKLGKEFDLSIADFAGMIIALGIFSSVVLEITTLLFNLFLIRVKYSKLLTINEDNIYKKSWAEVSMSELRDDALSEGDDLSFKIYSEEKSKRYEDFKNRRLSEIISFGTFFVFSIEWFFSKSNGSSKMFIDWLWEQSKHSDPTTPHYLIGLLVSLALLFYATSVCWPIDFPNKIYYPKLAEKLKKKEDEWKRKIDDM